MRKFDIPRKTVYRLSLYQRGLQRLQGNQVLTVSSEALAKAAGVKSTQLRKDLTYFGQFGTRGLGYDVASLSKKLDEVLGTTRLQPVILAGAGNLGTALLGYYEGFAKEGFEIVATFDLEAGQKPVTPTRAIEVLPITTMGEFVRTHGIKMAILSVQVTAAQEVVNALVAAGIQAVLNFAPIILAVPAHVVVNNVDLAIELENLSYFYPVTAPVPGSLSLLPALDFDLAATLNCGQVFHWRAAGPGYVGVIDRTPLYVEQRGDVLLVTPGTGEIAARYFALDHPLPGVYASLPEDPWMQGALAVCRGLRLIRQPLWECLATFITSALKQVSHIAQISHTLRQRYGDLVGALGSFALFSYPTPARLAALDEPDLRACGLGFRARSLLEAARSVAAVQATGVDPLEALRPMNRAETLAALTRFRGVGTKVANCVLLFGYEHLDAFPIDVWIERVLREQYFTREPEAPLARLQAFAQVYFGPYGGYAQQYLFHHARMTTRRKPSIIRAAEALPIRRVARRKPVG